MQATASLAFLALAISCLAETEVNSHAQTYGPPLSSSNVGVATSSVHTSGPATNVLLTAAPAAVVAKSAFSVPVYLNVASAPVYTNVAPVPVYTNLAYALPNFGLGDASIGDVSNGQYQGGSVNAEHGFPNFASGYYSTEAQTGAQPDPSPTASQSNKGSSSSKPITAALAPRPSKGSSRTKYRIVTSVSQTNVSPSGSSSGNKPNKVSSGSLSNAASVESQPNVISSGDEFSSGFDANALSSGFGSGLGLEYASGFQYGAPALPTHTTTSQITIEQPVPVPVYHPVRITVPRPAPYHVLQPYPVEVPRPVHVSVPQPIPFNVPRPYPVTVNKPYPIQVPHFVPVPVAQPVAVEVPKPYPVHVTYPVPVKQPYPVEIPVATPVADVAPPAAEVAKPAADHSASTSGVAQSGGPWSSSSGLGEYASLFSSLNLGGSSHSAPNTGSYSLDIIPSVEVSSFSKPVIGGSSFGDSSFDFPSTKYSGNLQGAPQKAPTGGPSGEKWTGLLTNDYKGTAATFQGFVGNLQGAFRPSKLVGSSLSTAGSFSSAVGATFRSNSFKAEDGDDYYPYP